MEFLSSLPSILMMLILISILIIAHEMGHFYVAKRCGVRVERFGFGLPFGPTLWSKKVGDTEYCIHAALFGGYVSFPDDTPDSPVPKDSPERFENQPLANRAAIALAGVTVNAILAWVLMFIVVMGWGIPSGVLSIQIPATYKELAYLNAPDNAMKAGLQNGDFVISVNGKPYFKSGIESMVDFEADRKEIMDTIKASAGKSVHLVMDRKGTQIEKDVPVTDKGKIGVAFMLHRHYVEVSNPIEGAGASVAYLAGFVKMNFTELGKMFTHFDPKKLGGPIQIVKTGSENITYGGIQEGIFLAAAVSIILAVMNLLPIPALDGGHILFIILEAIKGKPVNKEIQERFVQVGFVVLLSLMVFVLWNDINNIFFDNGEAPPVKQEQVKQEKKAEAVETTQPAAPAASEAPAAEQVPAAPAASTATSEPAPATH